MTFPHVLLWFLNCMYLICLFHASAMAVGFLCAQQLQAGK